MIDIYILNMNDVNHYELISEVFNKYYARSDFLKKLYFENGKPLLRDSNYFFSLSHKINTLALAIAQFPLGFDLEHMYSFNYTKIYKKLFKNSKLINNPDIIDKKNLLTFFNLWTSLEAYLKFTGEGFKKTNIENAYYNLNSDNIFHEQYENIVFSIYSSFINKNTIVCINDLRNI